MYWHVYQKLPTTRTQQAEARNTSQCHLLNQDRACQRTFYLLWKKIQKKKRYFWFIRSAVWWSSIWQHFSDSTGEGIESVQTAKETKFGYIFRGNQTVGLPRTLHSNLVYSMLKLVSTGNKRIEKGDWETLEHQRCMGIDQPVDPQNPALVWHFKLVIY
jgi:hypothetical protein